MKFMSLPVPISSGAASSGRSLAAAKHKDLKGVDQTYGPLDWRLPEAHAIYWAMVGIEQRPTHAGPPRRTIYQPMLASLHHGRVITNRLSGTYDLLSNLDHSQCVQGL